MDPVLNAITDIGPSTILSSKASQSAAGILARQLPRQKAAISFQDIDRQWRSLLIDNVLKTGSRENANVVDFWKGMHGLSEYRDQALIMLQITALLQSITAVECTFLKLNINKTKLRNNLAVSTIKLIVKVSETLKEPSEIDEHLVHLHGNARKSYMQKQSETDRKNVKDNGNFE